MEDENKLIRRIIKHSSREAADKLIRAYYDEIFLYMLKQVNDREDALDLTQEVFLAVLKGLSSFDSKKASFRTWIYRIATNKVIDRRRKKHMVVIPLDEETMPEKEDIAVNIDDKDLIEKIENWVSKLDPELQKIFRMHVYAEMTFKDIASSMGEPENTIKTKYYRLMKKIRKEFQNDR